MTLDKTQPWMSNHPVKVRILNAPKPMANPVMEAYRQEFLALALVPLDKPSDAIRDPFFLNR